MGFEDIQVKEDLDKKEDLVIRLNILLGLIIFKPFKKRVGYIAKSKECVYIWAIRNCRKIKILDNSNIQLNSYHFYFR